MTDDAFAAAIEPPDRTRRHSSFLQRLTRRAHDRPFALCVGIDPSPDALELLDGAAGPFLPNAGGRIRRAAAIERFAGLIIESARDHAAAIKPQLAWYEAAGAPGMRALERTVEFARTAGLLVVLDGKRGDVPHSAAAYADAWLGDAATSGIGGDALTVNVAVGRDALEAMARVAAARACGLYALLHTSNPGAAALQGAVLEDGTPWWERLAADIAAVDAAVGPGVVGAVVGATQDARVLYRARQLLPDATLLLPGVGAQGATADSLSTLSQAGSPPALVAASRSLLPAERSGTQAFRFAVDGAARTLAGELARVGAREAVR